MPPDLTLVETETLLAELGTRYNSVVFAGVQVRTDTDDYVKTYYSGSTTGCLGLSSVITSDLIRHVTEWRELAED